GINALVAEVFERKDEICGQIVASIVWQVQEAWLGEVLAGEAELVCRGCGVVESGPEGVLKRGRRRRRVRTSVGRVAFHLRQVTCRWCRKTWCPFGERLGLKPRQRVLEELLRRLVDWATELSYAKSSRLGEECLGATASPRRIHEEVQERGEDVEFTEHGPLETLVADGTKVPAGPKPRGEDVSLAFQIRGRRIKNGRPAVDKRVVGFGIGWGHWQETLATVQEPEVLVTDGETGVAELAEWYFPGNTRHQRCEWHISYGLGHALGKDGLSVEERKPLAGKLSGILARGGAKARKQYREFTDRLSALLGAHDQCHGARDARDQPTHRRGRSLEHPGHLQPPQAPAGKTTQS
ncbi:MAG TPA: hypothetical protein VE173_13805, partial [Longimicrobiales bacterium]|nr:hypothetical protein [Longimicrobiales bacterium]